MKKCNKCKIYFNTRESRCPLCQNDLKGVDCEDIFPENINLKANTLILKSLLFLSLSTIIISVFIELYLTNTLHYTLFIFGGLLANFMFIYFILKNKQDVLALFGRCGVVLIIILLFWYFITSNKVITNYIVPSICFLEILFNFISFIVLKKYYIVNYLRLILLNILLLVIPIVLILLKWTTYYLLSLICLLFTLIILLWLIIFYTSDIKDELNKIFNL